MKNVRFKKLYCITTQDEFKYESLVTVQNHENFQEITPRKSLNHPSVKILKKIPTERVEKVPEKIIAANPFDSIKKTKKTALTKESFFASFKKFEKIGNSTDKPSLQKEEEPVKVSLKGDEESAVKEESANIKVSKNDEEVVVKKQRKSNVKKPVQVKVSEKSINQEAALKDMFQNDNCNNDQDEEDQSEELNSTKKIRKKRKVLKTMTFMEGKYMSNYF